MRVDDIGFLVAYDHWATSRILAVLPGIDATTWSAPNAIGDRGLGGILLHQLGAAQRWRHGLSGAAGELPRPERGPLPSADAMAGLWTAEWAAWESWLETLDDAALLSPDEPVPMWQLLAHVMNHGTQHRAEAAALLTGVNRSPGDLDMLDYAEALAGPQPRSG